MTHEIRKLLKEARTIIRCHARGLTKDWDERATKALADTPPQRKPLTAEQIEPMATDLLGYGALLKQDMELFTKAVRAVEAAHDIKEKNT